VLLALADLRDEGLLLLQHFTWSTLSFGLLNHPLAVVVLLASPSLVRHYRPTSNVRDRDDSR